MTAKLDSESHLKETCPRCGGNGADPEHANLCGECNGIGRRVRHQHDPESGLYHADDSDMRLAMLQEQLETQRRRTRFLAESLARHAGLLEAAEKERDNSRAEYMSLQGITAKHHRNLTAAEMEIEILQKKLERAEALLREWTRCAKEYSWPAVLLETETDVFLAPSEQEEPRAEKCADCDIPLHQGTAKCFTVCDACWDKAYDVEDAAVEPKGGAK